MILTWMVAATLFALLIGAAAHATESAARLLSRQGRAGWVAALGVSVAWPVILPFITARKLVRLAPIVVGGGPVRSVAARLPAIPSTVASRLDAVLIALWALASVMLVIRLIRAQRTLSRISRSARRAEIDGHTVLVTEDIGPAVVGIASPCVAVPGWLTELDAPLRDLVLRHEREHCRSRDTALLWLGEVAVALVPWNPAVWWQSRRLRLALELDCDARTLDNTDAATMYGKLLLLIAQRQHMTRLAPMLAESNSHLSRRIAAMTRASVSNRPLRVALLAAAATIAIIAACSARVGGDLTSPPPMGGTRVSDQVNRSMQAGQPAMASGASPVYFEYQVEKPVTVVPGSVTPRYPAIMKQAGVGGEVYVSFVVDTTGRPDMSSLKVIKSSHQLFLNAVIAALPDARFVAAEVGGKKVKQLVQTPYVFQMPDTTPSPLRTP